MKKLFKVYKINIAKGQQYKLNFEISKSNQFSFGNESMLIESPRVWDALPYYIIPII